MLFQLVLIVVHWRTSCIPNDAYKQIGWHDFFSQSSCFCKSQRSLLPNGWSYPFVKLRNSRLTKDHYPTTTATMDTIVKATMFKTPGTLMDAHSSSKLLRFHFTLEEGALPIHDETHRFSTHPSRLQS